MNITNLIYSLAVCLVTNTVETPPAMDQKWTRDKDGTLKHESVPSEYKTVTTEVSERTVISWTWNSQLLSATNSRVVFTTNETFQKQWVKIPTPVNIITSNVWVTNFTLPQSHSLSKRLTNDWNYEANR